MAGSRITLPHQVVQHISVIPNPSSLDLHNLLLLQLARYLRGVGHPTPTGTGVMANTTTNLITDAMCESEEGTSLTYRAERFLALSTGSELLPSDPNWMITVRILGNL